MRHNGRLLVVGGLPDKTKKFGYGGATVLMQNFTDYLDERKVDYTFVQTNKYFNRNGKPAAWKNKLFFLMRFMLSIPFCDTVMFNFSDHATVWQYPFLQKVAKRLRKKIVFRKFGGSLDIYLSNQPEKVKAKTFKAIAAADLVLLETKAAIKHAGDNIGNATRTVWFPNVRTATDIHPSKEYTKRFVFISHILDEKGAGDILNVAQTLSNDYTIDFFGPIKEDKYAHFDWKGHNATYGGTLTSADVPKKLSEYNFLLLPSYREGYPGIIIEAMSVGVPAVTTAVGGIPEIVEDGHNGILIKPGDTDSLRERIIALTQSDYERMSRNALNRFKANFDSDKTNGRILKEIFSIQ